MTPITAILVAAIKTQQLQIEQLKTNLMQNEKKKTHRPGRQVSFF